MKQYFRNHKLINYNGQQLRNILSSAKLTADIINNTDAFLPYTVKEGETPTSVAFDYYGSVDYTWLVLLSNSIVDPYTSWPKTEEQLHELIVKEYGSLRVAYNKIHYFYLPDNPTHPPITPTTFEYMTPEDKGRVLPVYLYEWLVSENNRKRKILLIDKVHAPRISLELEKKLAA